MRLTVNKQLANLEDLPFQVSVIQEDDIYTFNMLNTDVRIHFPLDYPFSYPDVYISRNLINENIIDNRLVFVDWTMMFTIRQILLVVYTIMIENGVFTQDEFTIE